MLPLFVVQIGKNGKEPRLGDTILTLAADCCGEMGDDRNPGRERLSLTNCAVNENIPHLIHLTLMQKVENHFPPRVKYQAVR